MAFMVHMISFNKRGKREIFDMKVYITLDYELSLGSETGTPYKCLIEPMNRLTLMTDRHGIKLNVFVDAAYLLKMHMMRERYPKLKEHYEIVSNHIKQLDADGHSIQLHLHPQWRFSSFDGDDWQLDRDHYKLSDIPLDEQKQLIIEGTTLINSLISHKVSTFRAGGYSVENFQDLYETFLSVGIKNDTSVLRGECASGKYQTYDYRKVPLKTSWRFYDNIKEEDEMGGMMEYPISTIVTPAIFYLINKWMKHNDLSDIVSSKMKWGDGIGIGYPGNKYQILLKKIRSLFGKKAIKASIEGAVDLEKVYNYSSNHYQGDDFVIIGHPKAISPYSIDVLEKFINNHKDVEFCLF